MRTYTNPFSPDGPPPPADCLVAPRYLAGPHGSVHDIAEVLDGAEWRAVADHQDTDHFIAPDHKVCLAHLPHGQVPLPGPLGTGHRRWHLWGRTGPTGIAAWNATATPDIPPELIGAAVLAAADAEPVPYPDGEPPLAPLETADWKAAAEGEHLVCQSPDGLVKVRYNRQHPHPFLGAEAMPLTPAWCVITRHVADGHRSWRADFSATAPYHVVRAFFTALADPTPLPRRRDDISACGSRLRLT